MIEFNLLYVVFQYYTRSTQYIFISPRDISISYAEIHEDFNGATMTLCCRILSKITLKNTR